MNKIRDFIIAVLLTFSLEGCSQERTLLSEEIKNINPYSVGQKLIFVSSFGIEDTLTITNVEGGRFPDAIGAPLNEHFVVDAFRRSTTVRDGVDIRILTFSAKDPKYEEKIDFSFSLKKTRLQMAYVDFSDYQSRAELNLSTDFDSYDDVLLFENYPKRRIFDSEIVEFYWSKSAGYVRLIQKDGTKWDLKSIDTK